MAKAILYCECTGKQEVFPYTHFFIDGRQNMTKEQASKRFGVPLAKLQTYEKQGLFDCHKQPDGSIDYTEELMDYVGIINILMDAGAEVDALRDFMRQLMESTITKEEKLRYLRRQRQKLLEDIHSKQKSLDQLDYIIFDTNKATGSAV